MLADLYVKSWSVLRTVNTTLPTPVSPLRPLGRDVAKAHLWNGQAQYRSIFAPASSCARPRADAGSRIGTLMDEAAYSGPPMSPGRSGIATIDPRGIGLSVS
jgi:hypothetical protein